MEFTKELENCPVSHEYKMIFPYGYDENEFILVDFYEAHLEGRATQQDMERVLHSLSESTKICPKNANWVNILLVIQTVAVIPMLFVCSFLFMTQSDLINFIEFVILAVWYFGGIFLIFYIRGSKDKKYLQARKEDFEARLKVFNEVEFGAKGLSWKVGSKGAWIELSLDFKLLAMYQQYPGSIQNSDRQELVMYAKDQPSNLAF